MRRELCFMGVTFTSSSAKYSPQDSFSLLDAVSRVISTSLSKFGGTNTTARSVRNAASALSPLVTINPSSTMRCSRFSAWTMRQDSKNWPSFTGRTP